LKPSEKDREKGQGERTGRDDIEKRQGERIQRKDREKRQLLNSPREKELLLLS